MINNSIIARAAKFELARRYYIDYVSLVHHSRWKPARHLQIVCDRLQLVAGGYLKRLMIWMPPRHGKSMSVTETFPSFFIGKDPEKRVIEVSYGDDLAKSFGRKNREKIREFGKPVFGVELSRTSANTTNWGLQYHGGGMLSTSVGGGITGHGADLLLIDDPIKNRKEAESITYRERLWDEYQHTLLTRLQPSAAIIIIQTRWHEDDLSGRILNKNDSGEQWEIISLPAICDSSDDLLGRNIGDPLWPEHGFDAVWANNKKNSVGSYGWSSLYQQRPSPPEGGLFQRKWWKYWKEVPAQFDEIAQSWDCAFKGSDESDYVVGQVWGKLGGDRYLLDQVRGKMTFTETLAAFRSLSQKWPQATLKLVEDAANGAAVIDTLQKEIGGIVPVQPKGGKVARAQAASPAVEAGNVYLPEKAPWIHDFVEETAAFPNAKHDDQVDAMTQMLSRWQVPAPTWDFTF